jgi:hypothetical protein
LQPERFEKIVVFLMRKVLILLRKEISKGLAQAFSLRFFPQKIKR